MLSVEIIKLSQEHVGQLIRFFDEINSPEYTKDFSPHPFDSDYAGFICGYQGRDLYYALLLDGREIIGYFMLRGWDEGYEIPSIGLCILKKYRGFGLGKVIMDFLETVSNLNGCPGVMLKVNKDNHAARRLYETRGFVFKEYNEEFLIGYKEFKVRR